jgi:uncharacterized protein
MFSGSVTVFAAPVPRFTKTCDGVKKQREYSGSRGGNSARWLNHACVPNCEINEGDGRIFIHELRAIESGEEQVIEYLLTIDDPADERAQAQYACTCAAAGSRQSMRADAT